MDTNANAAIEAARQLDGSINLAIGPSGCGKTDLYTRISLAAGLFNGLKWYGYDSNGDVQRHFNRIRDFHRRRLSDGGDGLSASEHRARLDYLQNQCRFFRGPANLPKLLEGVKKLIDDGIKEAARGRLAKPKVIIFIDEAGAVRDEDEEFWKFMRQGRNAGATLYTTGHRVKDLHPAALAVTRTVMFWKPTSENHYEINGMKILRKDCSEGKSSVLKYIVGSNPTIRIWDRSKTSGYPPELIIPSQPTLGRDSGF